ncbi:apolipoprotein N-acyltransferase [Fodinicola feengrottensis]|uniref:apolipoprotein N-acyltransferase n=1 Tax=Fodinicola feengrottensis TaxID=435914 RepID=UPI0028BE4C7C|nr:apolipoprotein N-acyltransferase [Fodinicola feengrottensis]
MRPAAPSGIQIGCRPGRSRSGRCCRCAALLWLAFPPVGLWWTAPIALGLFALTLRGSRLRRGAWAGYLFGLVFFTAVLHWAGTYVGSVWLFLPVSQAAFTALLGALTPLTWRRPALLPALTGGAWVLSEALRSRIPFGGFPWARVAFSQADAPTLKLASLAGAPGVTFAVAATGGLLALALVWLLSERPPAANQRQLLKVVGAAAGAIALMAIGLVVPLPSPGGPTVTVAIIQGNVPRLGLDFNAQRRAVLDNHVNATMKLASQIAAGTAKQPDFVIWPENSSDIDPLANPDAYAEITQAAQAMKVPILIGGMMNGPGPTHVSNTSIVWSPTTGPGERYVKRHPVPFAEYIPLRSIARMVSNKVDLVPRDFYPGDRVGVMTMGKYTLADSICFEVAYDGLVHDAVAAGGQMIAVQTNNATFGKTEESAQQLAMVRFRAAEYGLPAVMASTTGISAVVEHDGTVSQHSGLFEQAILVEQVQIAAPGHQIATVAAVLGEWPEILASLATAVALALLWWTRPQRRLGRRREKAA